MFDISHAKVVDVICTNEAGEITHMSDPDSDPWFVIECTINRHALSIAYSGDKAYLFVTHENKLIPTVDLQISDYHKCVLNAAISMAEDIV